jgi:drug/metabolite transporter (DMT)-like permease
MIRSLAASGSALVFMGAVFWSFNSPLVKYLTLSPFLICALRSALAAIALLPFFRPRKLYWNRWLVLYLICYCFLCLSVIVSLTMTSAAIAVGMQYTAAVWLFAAGVIHTHSFRIKAFIPVLIITIGIICFMCSGGSGDSDTMGNLVALSEGIFFAGMSVSAQKAGSRNPLGLTAMGNILTALFVFLCFPAAMAGLPLMTGNDWLIMIILGCVQVACGYGFYNAGVQKISAQKASIIALWEMILGPLWVALFLHIYPSLLVLIGFVIILCGMLLEGLLNSERGNYYYKSLLSRCRG